MNPGGGTDDEPGDGSTGTWGRRVGGCSESVIPASRQKRAPGFTQSGGADDLADGPGLRGHPTSMNGPVRFGPRPTRLGVYRISSPTRSYARPGGPAMQSMRG